MSEIHARLAQLEKEHEATKAKLLELTKQKQELDEAGQRLAMSALRLEGAMTVLREMGAGGESEPTRLVRAAQ
jgi:hypothetical protein